MALTWEAFNLWLEEQCRKRQRAVLRGESEPIGERSQRDLAAMRVLPAAPFDACHQENGRASSQSLVRYKTKLLGAGRLRPSGCLDPGLWGKWSSAAVAK